MSDADVVMKTETPTETPPAPAAETPAEEKPAVAEEKEVKADGEGDVAEKEEKEEEKPVEREEEKELEQDDLPDKRKSFMSAKNAVSTELNNHDALLNTCVSEGRIAQCMDQSFPFLYGATRATRGIKKGRYFFEVQVVSAGYKFSPEFRVGFSTKGSSLLGGAKTSIFFDSKGFVHKGEERTEGTRFTMEVVGVLLNLIKDSPNCNTISLFLNGKRSSKPIPLQDELKDVALFPHVLPKFCTIAANFQHPICPLPFKAKMLDDAPKDDVEDGVKASKECEIVVPFGANCLEWATEFAKKNPECILVTHDLVKTWVRESGGRVDRVPLIDDGGKTLCRVMNFRKRRYVYAFGSSLLPEQRMEICKRFTNVKKTCYVHWSEDAPLVPLEYEKTSLPTEEEGFDKVVFEIKKEDVEEKLNVWKKQCKLHSCCDELKPGAFLKEKMAEYEALKKAYRNKGKEELKAEEETKAEEATQAEEKPKAEETPKTEESPKAEETPKAEDVNMDEKKEDAPAASEGNKGEDATETEDAIKKTVTEEQKLEAPTRIETPTDVSEWTDEDWMLADLRAELHLLCHAFREDVEDKERTAFPLTYLHHYYRVYFPTKTIRADTYACENFKDLVSTLMDDTVEVKDALLLPLLSKDEALEKIIEMTEDVRNMRTERVGAGDETAALKFKAVAVKQYSQQHHQQHSHQRGAYQNRAYQPYLQQNKGKGGYGFQKGSPAHHGGDRFQGDRFQGDRFQSNPSSQYQNRQQYQTQQPAGNFRSNYGSGGGYQQRSGYQQRAYDNNRGGQHQRQQYQHGGDQGHRPQSQQWGGVKRDQPSDGFHQQQPPNQRYPPRF